MLQCNVGTTQHHSPPLSGLRYFSIITWNELLKRYIMVTKSIKVTDITKKDCFNRWWYFKRRIKFELPDGSNSSGSRLERLAYPCHITLLLALVAGAATSAVRLSGLHMMGKPWVGPGVPPRNSVCLVWPLIGLNWPFSWLGSSASFTWSTFDLTLDQNTRRGGYSAQCSARCSALRSALCSTLCSVLQCTVVQCAPLESANRWVL